MRLGTLILAAATLAVTSGPVVWAGAEDVAKGRELAERLCAKCHLNPGQGEKAGSSGIPGFRAVANRPGQTLEGVVTWLRSVPPMMPNHRLSQDEMFALAHFIMSLRKAD